MSSLGDVCAFNNNLCPACGMSKLIRLDHIMAFQCNYCMVRFSEELMFMNRPPDEIASVMHELKRTWKKRVEVTNSMSTDALYDVLVQRGVLQPKPKVNVTKITGVVQMSEKDLIQNIVDGSMINEDMVADLIFLASNPPLTKPLTEPKPWSYEEAAASEFNIDEGTGLQ